MCPSKRAEHPLAIAVHCLPAIEVCVASRCCGLLCFPFSKHLMFLSRLLAVVMACTLGGPNVYFAQRDVSVDGLAQCAHTLPLVASHSQLQVTDGLVYIYELFI